MATDFKECVRIVKHERGRSLGDDMQRPMTTYESQVVYALYAISEYMILAKEVLHKRSSTIKRATARMGLIRWAARSLHDDFVGQMNKAGRDTFFRRAKDMQLSVNPRRVQERTSDGWKLCSDRDLEALSQAAYHSECQFCGRAGQEAKACPLRRALDGLQCIEPSDNPDCWYKGA